MKINKIKLIGKIPEDPNLPLESFDCEVYLNDSDRPADNIKSIQIFADASARTRNEPDVYVKLELYVNEIDVELKNPSLEVEEVVKDKPERRLGYRLPG